MRSSWILAVGLLLAVTDAGATTYTWPGASPCNTTLPACVNGANQSDTIAIQQSDVDVGSSTLVVEKMLNLVAATGFRPVFRAGQSIEMRSAAGNNYSASIRGLTLLDGNVQVVFTEDGPQNETITLSDLDIRTTSTNAFSIGIYDASTGSGSGQRTIEIARNRIRSAGSSASNGDGILVYHEQDTSPTLYKIHDNRIYGDVASTPDGINLTLSGHPVVQIYSNQLQGHFHNAIVANSGVNRPGTSFAVVAISNAIRCSGGGVGMLAPYVGSGTIDAEIFNNTIVGCDSGFVVPTDTSQSSVIVGGRIANNLIANNGTTSGGWGIFIPPTISTLSNDHNLLHGNSADQFVPGAGTIAADPLLVGNADPRLTASSPAIDAADTNALRTLLTNMSLPAIDADGVRRFKGLQGNLPALADVGAFEYGDLGFVLTGYQYVQTNPLQNESLVGLSAVLAVGNGTPATGTGNSTDAAYIGFGEDHINGPLTLYDEISYTLVPDDGAYNVFVPGAGDGSYLHTSHSATNISGPTTYINDPYFNSHPERIVLAAHRIRGGNRFPCPFAVFYGFGEWFIEKISTQPSCAGDFPDSMTFDVYGQDRSLTAFTWTVGAGGTPATPIDHFLLNNEPCAHVSVTNGVGSAANSLNPHPFQVAYIGGYWNIVNLDHAPIPAGAVFDLLINEHATEVCTSDLIFSDGFEAH